MKRVVLITSLLLLCTSCLKPQRFYSSLVLINKTGYNIEVFKDDEYHATVKNDKDCEIFRGECPDDIENVNIEELLLQTEKISIWKIEGDNISFLKEWLYKDRNEPGKQLFRPSDYTHDMSISSGDEKYNTCDYRFSITIYNEDL